MSTQIGIDLRPKSPNSSQRRTESPLYTLKGCLHCFLQIIKYSSHFLSHAVLPIGISHPVNYFQNPELSQKKRVGNRAGPKVFFVVVVAVVHQLLLNKFMQQARRKYFKTLKMKGKTGRWKTSLFPGRIIVFIQNAEKEWQAKEIKGRLYEKGRESS